MKMRRLVFSFLILSVLGLAACKSERQKAVDQIDRLGVEMFSDSTGMLDQLKADELIRSYIDFADRFPEDSLAPVFLFRAGDLMMNLSSPSGAVTLFERIRSAYPDHERADEALFLKAFVMENQLGDLDQARALYTKYLEEYPEGEFADDAQVCIMNLGKSAEDLIREFEARQAAAAGDSLQGAE